MKRKQNTFVLLSLFSVALSLATHFLHRGFGFLDTYVEVKGIGAALPPSLFILQNVLMILPVGFFIWSMILYKRGKDVSLLLTLSLTFSSISIIAGGDGLVEYHFSIFMVLAFIAFFDSIKLLLVSTILFAVQHLLGYFLFPELICGTSEYRFSLLMIHAVYLIFTSGATMLMIHSKQKQTNVLQEENRQHQENSDRLIRHLHETVAHVSKYSAELAEGARESTTASREMASSVEEMITGARQQLEFSQQSEREYQAVDSAIKEITESLKLIGASSESTTQKAESGQATIQEMEENMKAIKQAVADIHSLMEQFRAQSDHIETISGTIADISGQTKMLALNASIEAARAGEHGKGFAIVAQEVGKLADQTEKSTKGITGVVSNIRNEMNEMEHAISTNIQEVEKGMSVVDHAQEIFQDIMGASREVEAKVTNSYFTAEQLKKSSIQVMDKVGDMRSISDITLDSSEKIFSFSTQQAGTIANVQTISSSLQERVKSLNTVVEKMDGEV
ncbi:methyl-accepting chemotaxis protein [Rossellomorea sp. AcN35-11]|nr:methyl-accepting chemotaxis protein [Rossellomorea aquimaris]WJV29694.1 methyl-accepting chemotaxis protein [Rossellomorea sp. AcN35-11]